jgi:uncharacterized Zn finger protein (UPF0148 family)
MKRTKIQAYMNNGRWLLDCPVCSTPLPAVESGVICPRCHPGMLAKALRPLPNKTFRPVMDVEIVEKTRGEARARGEEYTPDFPRERSEIEKILRARPGTQNMNWIPTETLDDLRAQNREHGDPEE